MEPTGWSWFEKAEKATGYEAVEAYRCAAEQFEKERCLNLACRAHRRSARAAGRLERRRAAAFKEARHGSAEGGTDLLDIGELRQGLLALLCAAKKEKKNGNTDAAMNILFLLTDRAAQQKPVDQSSLGAYVREAYWNIGKIHAAAGHFGAAAACFKKAHETWVPADNTKHGSVELAANEALMIIAAIPDEVLPADHIAMFNQNWSAYDMIRAVRNINSAQNKANMRTAVHRARYFFTKSWQSKALDAIAAGAFKKN